jgi:hypothetical protein
MELFANLASHPYFHTHWLSFDLFKELQKHIGHFIAFLSVFILILLYLTYFIVF